MLDEGPRGDQTAAREEVLSSAEPTLASDGSSPWLSGRPPWTVALVAGLLVGLLGGWWWAGRSDPVPTTAAPTITIAVSRVYLQGGSDGVQKATAYLDGSVVNTAGVGLDVVSITWGGLENRVQQPLPAAASVDVMLTTPIGCDDVVATDAALPDLSVRVRTVDGGEVTVEPQVLNAAAWDQVKAQCSGADPF